MFEVRFKKYWLALPFGNPDMEYDPDIEGDRAFARAPSYHSCRKRCQGMQRTEISAKCCGHVERPLV